MPANLSFSDSRNVFDYQELPPSPAEVAGAKTKRGRGRPKGSSTRNRAPYSERKFIAATKSRRTLKKPLTREQELLEETGVELKGVWVTPDVLAEINRIVKEKKSWPSVVILDLIVRGLGVYAQNTFLLRPRLLVKKEGRRTHGNFTGGNGEAASKDVPTVVRPSRVYRPPKLGEE